MRAIFRSVVVLGVCGLLAACSDGRGSQYSSQRATSVAATSNYIPITPNAVPITMLQQGELPPISTEVVSAPTTSNVLTRPIAVTPNATPILEPAVQTAPVVAPSLAQPVVAPKPIQVAAPVTPRGPRFSKGPIYSACLDAGRKQATAARCGCVQWVANTSLTSAQQRRGAGYFKNQHGVQEARQSDRATDEQFWKTWKAFGSKAAKQCSGT